MLAATATGLTLGLSGCIREFRTAVNRNRLDQLSLSITTQPADGDRQAIQIVRRLADHLETVGIDTSIRLRSSEEFRRETLINHDFDLYVGRHPGGSDPDFLYEALYSRYAEEAGWQNPFGVADTTVDRLLDRQRVTDGEERRDAVEELLEYVALEQPFVPICRFEEVRLARTTRFDGWNEHALATRLGYLDLEPGTEADPDEPGRLRGTVIYASPSENVNPLTVEYRYQPVIMELLYDSLATPDPETDELVPWLASEWTYQDGRLEMTIRDDHTFHDGEPVTADDVEFTYRFLADTAMGQTDVPAPSPHYRGLASAIDADAIETPDNHTIAAEVDAAEAVVERALTVPILPQHIWEPRADPAHVRGVRVAQDATEALVVDNVPAIGSGPFRFDERVEREHLSLERFDDHFTTRPDVDLPAATATSFRAQIDPRSPSAIALIENDDADVTISPLEAYALGDLEDTDELRRLQTTSQEFYHLGFNVRRGPCSNPYFRQAVARLIDKAWAAETVFEGYATPIATPVFDEWMPQSLAFEDGDPVVPFHGTGGELDAAAARSGFEEAGYRYDGETLVVRS
ncbi:ABC transporter substrate-binding protein [Natronosalvus vescus]|uniref:ABC transporter substrate-binding protein n=1 Tax=Natronosalvus vescus TaxID=2953881 RepID=UPI00209151D3|nr:ABC transporter substrate-binding protein [Natronosalvus vescus]